MCFQSFSDVFFDAVDRTSKRAFMEKGNLVETRVLDSDTVKRLLWFPTHIHAEKVLGKSKFKLTVTIYENGELDVEANITTYMRDKNVRLSYNLNCCAYNHPKEWMYEDADYMLTSFISDFKHTVTDVAEVLCKVDGFLHSEITIYNENCYGECVGNIDFVYKTKTVNTCRDLVFKVNIKPLNSDFDVFTHTTILLRFMALTSIKPTIGELEREILSFASYKTRVCMLMSKVSSQSSRLYYVVPVYDKKLKKVVDYMVVDSLKYEITGEEADKIISEYKSSKRQLQIRSV